jgi:ATP-binding cassette subfamily B protein
VPIAATVVYALRASLTASNTAFRREIEQMSSRVTEMTHLIPITRAHGLEISALERVDQSIERVRDAALQVDATNATFGALAWVTFNLFNMACLVFAAWVYARHWLPITLGDVVMLTTYFALMTNSVLTLVSTAPQATKGLEAIRSIGEVLQCPDLELNEGKALVAAVRGEFTFEAVSFRYPEAETAAIENFDLRVQPGETVALVGPSGAGKSTVLNLAIGFLRPTAGRILLDGQDMAGLDLRAYRRFVSVVPQESILFDGSIRENVTYGM